MKDRGRCPERRLHIIFHYIKVEVWLTLATQLNATIILLVQMSVLACAALYSEKRKVHGVIVIVVSDIECVSLSFLDSVEAVIKCARGLEK